MTQLRHYGNVFQNPGNLELLPTLLSVAITPKSLSSFVLFKTSPPNSYHVLMHGLSFNLIYSLY